MSASKLKNLSRLLSYERLQYETLIQDLVSNRASISKIEEKLGSLARRQQEVLQLDEAKLCDLQLQFSRKQFLTKMEQQMDSLTEQRIHLQLAATQINDSVLRQRSRVKSIELLENKSKQELIASLQHQTNIEQFDLILNRFRKRDQ